ncbi:glutathione S-transferase T3-like [Chenopodium quinoa]|uniref:glutathione S-transferase T3-like n=1 Tax=Chenopodium quinoa TaxID=63459 RepID=UPI000B778768|nr:glutathione S-transferase T3-like [Chenopodium quinoa]
MAGFPISEHFTQNMDQSPGGFGGSNATPIEESGDEHVEQLVGAQHLEDINDVDVEIVSEQNVNTTGQRKNQSWSIAEDKALVSAYINAGGDVVRGTKTKRSGLWVDIYNRYERSRMENPDETKVRKINALFCLLHCFEELRKYPKWDPSLAKDHYRTKGSGESEQNLEKFAHKDYYATNNKMFCLLHCFEELRKYPKWDPSLAKYQSTMLPGGQQTSTESGGSGKRSQPDSPSKVGGRDKRPAGIKQTKMKGKASTTSTSSINLEALNTNFNEVGDKLNDLGGRLLDQLKERDEIKKAQVEEKKRQKNEAMKFRMLERLMQKPVLNEVELEMYKKLRDEFSSRFSI